MSPKVSVLMAVHKHDRFLDAAILSIVNQTFKEYEFIIIANAVSDDFIKILRDYSKFDSRIIVYAIPLPGLANALNHGLSIAKAPLIARMDADDISHPDRLYQQYRYMTSEPATSIVGCKSDLIDLNDNVIGEFPFFGSNKSIRRVLPYRNPLLHPAIMLRKDAILKVGGYRYGHMSEDHELYIRMARDPLLIFCNLDIKLFMYRRHENQITSIGNAHRSYAEISGFLITEFILSKNPLYLIGSLAVHPFVRRVRKVIKNFIFKIL